MEGWIKDHRRELESDIWIMPPLYHRVWQYLKYTVNHEPRSIPMHDGTTFDILPGQHLTSVRGIAKAIGWYEGRAWREPNPKTIKVILDWMIKHGMIFIDGGRGNRQYTLITLINWALYQSQVSEGNTKVTVKKQRSDINKNDKNKKEKYIEHFESLWRLFPRKEGKQTILKSLAKLEEIYDVGFEPMKTAIENYKKATYGREKKFIMMGGRFFGGAYTDYLLGNYSQDTHEEGDTYAGLTDYTGQF